MYLVLKRCSCFCSLISAFFDLYLFCRRYVGGDVHMVCLKEEREEVEEWEEERDEVRRHDALLMLLVRSLAQRSLSLSPFLSVFFI